MIRVDVSENFPITVSLIDENTGTLAGGQTVTYDIRDLSDNPLSPPISGTLTESTVTSGIYRATESIPQSGNYMLYAESSGYITNTEEIVVNPESVYNLVKQVRHYNISPEDVLRSNVTPTASQTIRNVPFGKTDYVINIIKDDSATTWSGATTSGILYAWYTDISDLVPYKMGGPS